MTVKVDDVVGISGFIMPERSLMLWSLSRPPTARSPRTPSPKSFCKTSRFWPTVRTLTSLKANAKPTASRQSLYSSHQSRQKLALASSEGKLQLVMRNSIDQGDEQTIGINKENSVGWRCCDSAAEPGSLKSERPAEQKPAPRRVRVQSEAKPAAPAAPPAPKASVEMIEGAKKRNVDFP